MKALQAGLIVAIGCVLGCTEPNPAYNPDPLLPGECRDGIESTETLESFERPDKLDVLFIVDNSGDVEDLQNAMAIGAARWLDGLKDELDIHVAVATAEATASPTLAPPGTTAEGCQGNTTAIARSSQSNFQRLVACNIIQGDQGDAYQQSLGVLEGLLFETVPAEFGFFRDDARLLVIVVSNEDDCTHESTLTGAGPARQNCVDNLDKLSNINSLTERIPALSNTPQGFSLVVISGPPSAADTTELRPVCSSSLGAAYPSPRLYATTRLLGPQGHFVSACTEDFITILGDLTQRYALAEHIALCPAKQLAHEPLDVTGFNQDEDPNPITLGAEGFLFLGPTEFCPNGELNFNADALLDVERVEVRYCAVETE